MKHHLLVMASTLIFSCGLAQAAVSAQEAARLKSELTPLGGEKAGNADGTIPAWTGGHTTPIPGDKPGGRRGDPFKDEKPLFSINAANMAQYADRLSDGQKALLQKYPDYRIDVYPTHRTAAAPQWVYDNTFANATSATLEHQLARNFYGGIPFPIPNTGEEVMWNHMLRWRGVSWQQDMLQVQLTSDGRAVLATDGVLDIQMPIYFQEGSWETFQARTDTRFWQMRLLNEGPPIRAGELITGGTPLDLNQGQAWVYLAGQRRVRKLPNPCCDTPTPSTAGLMSFDELSVWTGRLTRFEWTLIGKQEMYIPYNENRMIQPNSLPELLGSHFVKPEHRRWELHRVWVVEATLATGQRHQVHKSRYYCDEDTWACVLGDRWDGNGQLWKTLWGQPIVAPDLPATMLMAFGYNDLLSGTAFLANLPTGKPGHYVIMPRYPDEHFTPDALAAEGVR